MSNGFRDYEKNDENEILKEENGYGIDKGDLDDRKDQKEAEEERKEEKEDLQTQEKRYFEEGRKDNQTGTEAGEEEGYNQKETEAEAESPQISSDGYTSEPSGSYRYVPPRYASDFSATGDGDGKRKRKESRGKLGVAIIALCVVVAIAFTAILPSFLFWGIGNVIDTMFDISMDNGDGQSGDGAGASSNNGVLDDMNVIKNDGSINVNVQVGSTGYSGDLSIAEVVELVADTVVEITTTNVVTDRFYGQYVTSGAGSGVIISENGYIITNHHVIDGARSITVRLTDGSEFSAALIGSDENKDIAVLKISATGLNAAVLGSSASLSVGQEVVAIGNPLGSLGGTVTDGIISALDRTVIIDGHRMTLMQTNAAINPGNSGGGLFNRAGELIGIVNAKQSETGIEGLGFAIPIDIAWETVEAIVQ